MISLENAGGRLATALLASVSLHIAAIGLLGAVAPTAQRLPGGDTASLEIRLLSPPSGPVDLASALMPLPPQPPASSPPAAIAMAPVSGAAASDADRRETRQGSDAPASTGFIGRVDVGVSPSLGVIGEALQGRAFTEFPVEIEKPVQLLGVIDVPYPQPALAANIEGTVYAWVLVNQAGSVDEVEIADGPPELGAAVQEAVADARFSPAMDQGVPIRHYIVLEIRFHIDPRPGPGRAAR
jgi:TonB family protein